MHNLKAVQCTRILFVGIGEDLLDGKESGLGQV